jgi:outer membrane protein OmpA-like peptidoglycan-associated protein
MRCAHRFLARFALGLLLAGSIQGGPSLLHAQGVGLAAVPAVERAWWGSHVLLPDATYLGGTASLHFGRFVALDGHFLRSGTLTIADGPDVVSQRYGGDVLFVLTPARFTPFLRVGSSVLEFKRDGEDGERVTSRHLAASLGAGVRFDLHQRFRGELTLRHLGFRASPGSGLFEGPEEGDDSRRVRKLTLGLGLHVPVGGVWDDPATDEAVRGLQRLSVPAHTFVGSLRFHDRLELPQRTVAGLTVGSEFGPYVGLRGYGFGSVDKGFESLGRMYGYGLEGTFNLVSREAPATPQLIVGAGQLRLTEEERSLAGLRSPRTWTATLGAGVDMKLHRRFHVEASARNLLLSRSAPGEVQAPDQIRSNWLLSGGLRFQLRGEPPGRPPVGPSGTDRTPPPPEARVGPRGPDSELGELEMERERLIQELQVERLRQALEELREAGNPTEADRLLARYLGDPHGLALPQTIEIPVLESGEVHIRFGPGESGVRTPADPEAAPPRTPSPGVERDPRVDELVRAVTRLEARVEELRERPSVVPGTGVQVQVAPDPAPARPAAPRGILRGDPIRPRGVGLHGGASFGDGGQGLAGLQVDLGSALGGGIRVRPDLSVGVSGDMTVSGNLHVEWPLPFRFRQVQPFVGGGLGLLRAEGITRLMVPNLLGGVSYPVTGSLEAFATLQSLDLLDHHRLLLGLRLRPRERAPLTQVRTPPSDPAAPPPEGQRARPDPEVVRELEELRAQLAALRTELERAQQPPPEEAAEPVPEEARVEDPEEPPEEAREEAPSLRPPAEQALERLQELTALASVLDVRTTDRGIVISLGGGDTFSTAASSLSPSAHDELQAVARSLVGTPFHLSVEGHTDSRGDDALNQRLSEQRAEAVRGVLLAYGIGPSRVTSVGFGSTRPIADNQTSSGRSQNRRVDIVLLSEGSRDPG